MPHNSIQHHVVNSTPNLNGSRPSEFALLDAFDPLWREHFGADLQDKGLTDDFIKENQEFIVDFLREEQQKANQPHSTPPPPPAAKAPSPTPTANGSEGRGSRAPPPPPPPGGRPQSDGPPAPPAPRKGGPHLLQPRDGRAKLNLRRRMLRLNERRHLLDPSLVSLLHWPTLANSHVKILQGLFQQRPLLDPPLLRDRPRLL